MGVKCNDRRDLPTGRQAQRRRGCSLRLRGLAAGFLIRNSESRIHLSLDVISQQANFRIQKIVATVSVLLFAVKLTAWWMTGSVAILTDALESTVNVMAGFISLYSLWVAAKPRDEDHPYGHGKAEFVSAAFEGSMIFLAGIMISGLEYHQGTGGYALKPAPIWHVA